MAYQFNATPWVLQLEDGTTRTVPTSWQDLTMRSYSRLLSETAALDIYGLLGSICDCTRLQILGLEPEVGKQLVELLQFTYQAAPSLGAWPLPKTIHVPSLPDANGYVEVRELEVPKSLEVESFGQSVDLATALKEYGNDFGELRRQALAIYLLPKYFNCKYDADLLEPMLLLVDRIRLGEGLPVADFFIVSLSKSKQPTSSSSNLYPSRLQSKRQDTRILAKLGTPTLWQRLWRTGINSAWGKSFYGRWGKYLQR